MWYSIRITVRCGSGVHSIAVSQKAFAEIRAGKEMTLQGAGFVGEKKVVVADNYATPPNSSHDLHFQLT
jgi:hypothetical protein